MEQWWLAKVIPQRHLRFSRIWREEAW
jgi:hypothetical protein